MPDEFQTPAPQPMLSPETLQDGPWFESVRKAYEVRTRPVHPPRWLVPVIGFWQTATSIARADLIDALEGRNATHPRLAAPVASSGNGLVPVAARSRPTENRGVVARI